jgi:hypothetical protein
MADRIFDPSRHAPLHATPWDEVLARAAIEAIAGDTFSAASKDGLWPVHPEDKDGDTAAFFDLYLGAAGVVWALDELHRLGAVSETWRRDLDVSDWIRANRACFPGNDRLESLLSGDAGLLITQYRRAPAMQTANALAHSIAVNLDHPALEMMWGPAGSMLAAIEMFEATGEERWLAHYRKGADILLQTLQFDQSAGTRLWMQDLWNRKHKMLGAVHGFAGNARALIRGREHIDPTVWTETSRAFARTLERTAIRGEDGLNWPSSAHRTEPGWKLLLQICHGAPGMVVCMAGLDQPIDDLLIEAGETIWRAGPLAKGSNLCHGTSGNGWAFLTLFARTQDELWLTRARAFAMHAIAQCNAERDRFGMRRFSLWTGDLGVALYIEACVSRRSAFPTLG